MSESKVTIVFDPPIVLPKGGKIYGVACDPPFVLVVRRYNV